MQTRVWVFFAHNLISACLTYTNLTNFLHLFPHQFFTEAAKHLKKKMLHTSILLQHIEIRFRTFTLLNLYTLHTLWALLIHDSMRNSSHEKAPREWIHTQYFSILLPTHRYDLFSHHTFYSNYSWNMFWNCLKITLQFWMLFSTTLNSFPASLISYWFSFIAYHCQT